MLFIVLCGLVGALMWRGERIVGLLLTTLFQGYLRPSEGHRLRNLDLLEPVVGQEVALSSWCFQIGAFDSGQPSKTGVFDDVSV